MSPSSASPRPAHYRPDVDGLRALAILGVLVFHADPRRLPGGYLGVDIFFVISGYLITSILRRECAEGRFSLLRFYERRVRRIIPALFVLLAVASLAAGHFLFLSGLIGFAKSAAATVLSVANLHFLFALRDYFGPDAHAEPLLHTWSLAVEEQYYLVFPLLLAWLHRTPARQRAVPVVLWGLLTASLAARVLLGPAWPGESFYLLPFRSWELLIGSVLAWMGPARGGARAVSGSFAGLGLILTALAGVGQAAADRGLPALLACLGTALVIRAGEGSDGARIPPLANRALAWRPLVFLGLISYSVYLWHWPLLVFGQMAGANPWGMVALSLVIGALSWRWVENPFRAPGFLGRRTVFAFWAVGTAVFLLAALAVRQTGGLPGRFSEQTRHYLSFRRMDAAFALPKALRHDAARAPALGAPGVAPTFAIWGDSHAEALLPLLDDLARARGVSFLRFTLRGQAPVPGVVAAGQAEPEISAAYTDAVAARIAADPALRTVLLHARWSFYNRGDNSLRDPPPTRLHGREFASSADLDTYYLEHLRRSVQTLLAAGKRVILVYPVPEAGVVVPEFLARHQASGQPVPAFLPCQDFAERHRRVTEALDSLAGPGLLRIRPHERLLEEGRLRVRREDRPLYSDDDHLGPVGLEEIRPLFEHVFD